MCKLISTKPDSAGKTAALARSAQLTEFRWTPLRDVPTYTKAAGRTVLPAGVEVVGMPYSSTEPTDKFIAENVSFETLLSAMANPDSVLYTKDLGGRNNAWAYYGIVCNGLVRYALGIHRRYNTMRWGDIPGMRQVAPRGAYSAEEIRLCDVLHAFGEGRNHVALITDILRDEDGVIRQIEVSEAARPSCRRVCYSVEEYFEKFDLFALWRYDFIDDVPPYDDSADAMLAGFDSAAALPAITVDNGDKSNYLYGEETVLSIFKEGQHTLEIRRNGTLIEKLEISAPCRLTRTFEAGYYTASLAKAGESTEFCVNRPDISYERSGDSVAVRADACDPDSRILYMDFRMKTSGKSDDPLRCAALSRVEELSEEEISSGVITREIPDDAGNFKVYFINRYGVWTHRMLFI